MSAAETALAARLRTELADLECVVARVEHLATRARECSDSDYLDGVALNLHGFYAGVEHLFEIIARELDRAVPSGPEWHRDLLAQLGAPVPSIRPAVVGQHTRSILDEYRGFRHVVRNVYTFNLIPSRIVDLADGVRSCYESVAADLLAFCSFLEALAS